ncbi:MAG: hypothetical protein M3Y27_03545 [Acidobacteriota bacterium]|nr:hypothetical protein [Acidobacteriota bacterium]
MKQATAITCVFLDIGGVLLTDGWNHHARKRAAAHFKMKWAEMEDCHQLNFATYEEGKLTLEEYLSRVVFYKQKAAVHSRSIQELHVRASKPYPAMIGDGTVNSTQLGRLRLKLETRLRGLSSSLRNRRNIAVERTSDALDDVELAGERDLAVWSLDKCLRPRYALWRQRWTELPTGPTVIAFSVTKRSP